MPTVLTASGLAGAYAGIPYFRARMKNEGYRILFVCLGNICRSPLAEGILLHLNEELQLGWHIDSAGTSGYHIGEAPDHRTIVNAAAHGVDLKPLRARQFDPADFDRFDLIFVMDQQNLRNVLNLTADKKQQQKVLLFLEYTGNANVKEVPDPYYGDASDFEQVFQLLQTACRSLVDLLQHGETILESDKTKAGSN